MRKILSLTRYGTAVLSAVYRHAKLSTLGAGLAVTFCCSSNATAQTTANFLAPAASLSSPNGPVSSAEPFSLSDQAVDAAAYSVMTDKTSVQPAAHRSGGILGSARNYCPPAANIAAPGCEISWYVNYDALFLRRENNEFFTLSNNSFLPDFEYEFGGRYTIGRLLDCVNGWEAVYTGPYDWQRQAAVVGTGNLQSRFFPTDGFTASDISAFNDADQHVQAWRAQLNSVELNRRWWTWDVLSTMIGVRYVDYEESFLFLSDRQGVGTGIFNESTDNQMIGAQFGMDILYPVNLRTNFGVRGKGGVYANFDERTNVLQNAGTLIHAAGDRSVDVAGLIEMGAFINYAITPSVRLTGGYEVWYMPGIATVPEQSPHVVSPLNGFNVSNDDELFLHGGSLGLQVLF